LLTRHPFHHLQIQESIDDYTAALSASYLLDHGRLAKFIIRWGEAHRWVFNNVDPLRRFTWSAWLGRFPALRAHAYFSASLPPWFWWRILWIGTVLWACRAKRMDQDAWALTWHMVKVRYNRRYFFCNLASLLWRKVFKYHWPHGFGQMISEPHPDGSPGYFSPEHPHAKWLRDDFGD